MNKFQRLVSKLKRDKHEYNPYYWKTILIKGRPAYILKERSKNDGK